MPAPQHPTDTDGNPLDDRGRRIEVGSTVHVTSIGYGAHLWMTQGTGVVVALGPKRALMEFPDKANGQYRVAYCHLRVAGYTAPGQTPPNPRKDPPPMDTTCHCMIHHPQNSDERSQLVDALDYARRVGDVQGISLTMTQLQGPCPAWRGDGSDDGSHLLSVADPTNPNPKEPA